MTFGARGGALVLRAIITVIQGRLSTGGASRV
jgi:hypothetical protein